MPMSGQGVASGWNREHVWPKSYGVGYTGADTSDLHSLRAADWNVNSARGNKFFDDCFSSECQSPAHPEASDDTATRPGAFMPPADVRGDLARSIFYMALRYEGDESQSTDLKLCELPDAELQHMGILSTMLEWHEQDPPSQDEIARNGLVCSEYQV